MATTAADAEQYEAEDYRRIKRDTALHMLSRRAGNGETLYVGATLNGADIDELGHQDRHTFARQIRRGEI